MNKTKSKYKLEAVLDLGELEDLLELIRTEIIKYTTEAKMKKLCRELTNDEYKWHLSYARYLKSLKKKLKFSEIKLTIKQTSDK